MNNLIKCTLASVVLSLISTVSLAIPTTYTVSDNITGDVFVPPSINGSFDLTSTLASYSNAEILGGTATFLFNDDSFDTSSSTSSSYYTHWYTTYPNGWYNYQIRYLNNRTTVNSDAYENFFAEIGTSTASGSTSYFDTGSTYTGRTFNSANYNFNWWGDDAYYYSNNYLRSNGYSGNVSLSLTLDEDMINEILTTGGLGFEVGALSGNGWFSAAALTLTIDEGAVPEPSILALFGAGLFGIAYVRRRKIRQS